MNDDGTRPEPTPEQEAMAHDLVTKSYAKSWAFVSLALATEFPHLIVTPDIETWIQMGITAGQVGTVETIKELGLA